MRIVESRIRREKRAKRYWAIQDSTCGTRNELTEHVYGFVVENRAQESANEFGHIAHLASCDLYYRLIVVLLANE